MECYICHAFEEYMYQHKDGKIICEHCFLETGGIATKVVNTEYKVQEVISILESHIRVSKQAADGQHSDYLKDLISNQTEAYRRSLAIVKEVFNIKD